MKKTIKVAVISDMHCRHSGGDSLIKSQTYLTTDLDLRPIYRHPVEALKKMIIDQGIVADILLCPGDITDKMDKAGLFSGWQYLQDIQATLKSDTLISTLGNHDVDSRKIHPNPHPFDIIKQLEDKGHPTDNPDANEMYYSKNFCIIEHSNCCVLNINSTYTHVDEKGAETCIITQPMIDRIGEELTRIEKLESKIKLCLLHHHPDHHSNFDLKFKDKDFLENGDRLLELLATFRFQIVVHGHKHEPKLRYFQRLPIFASGSFSSMMNIVDIGAQNTFHLITLVSGSQKGTIESWCYGPTKGWTRDEGTYFPNKTGFGALIDVHELAEQCNNCFESMNESYLSFSQLENSCPDINYLVPLEQRQLSDILYSKYGLKVYPSIFNNPECLIKYYS